MTSRTLSDFGTGSTEPTGGLTGIANAARLVGPREREDVRGWETASTEYGLITHRASNSGSSGHSHSPSKQEVRWVSGGDLSGYVEKHGDRLMSIPSTYGGFNSFDTYLSCVDGLVPDNYGYGIDGIAAERALRTLIDGGRYKHNRYNLIACGKHPWLLSGPEGVVLCSPAPVGRSERIARTVSSTIGTQAIEVEEENPLVLRALDRVATYLAGNTPEQAPDTNQLDDDSIHILGEHIKTPTNTSFGGCDYHLFADADEDSVMETSIAREDLRDLGTMSLTIESLPGWCNGATVAPPNGGPAVEIPYENYRDIGKNYDEGLVIGYDFDWESFEYSPEQVAVLTTYHLTVDKRSDRREVRIERTYERLQTTSTHYETEI